MLMPMLLKPYRNNEHRFSDKSCVNLSRAHEARSTVICDSRE